MEEENLLKIQDKKDIVKLLKILALLFTIGGVFGFIYEELFYRVDLGYWVKRGSTFGPWIPIYGFGSMGIFLATYCFRKKPAFVFLLACLVSGILEYGTGIVLDKMFNTRLWDYNTEIWNWGNIQGYICARSILFFGVSGLLLMYLVYPIVTKLKSKLKDKAFTLISLTPAIIFAIDIIVNLFV